MGREQLEHVPTAVDTSGCLYDMAGILCGKPIRARGYCQQHYKVLNRRGAFKPAIPKPLTPGNTAAGVERNLGHLDRAREALDAHAEKLVEHLMTAVEVAARKGDSRPAEWGLLHTRTVQPVLTGGGASGKGSDVPAGIRVMIGVQLGQGAPSQRLDSASAGNPTIQIASPIVQIAGEPTQIAGDSDRTAESLPTLDAQFVQP